MTKPNIAILGATGLVGSEILKILQENNVPFGKISLLATEKSAGKKVLFGRYELIVENASVYDFSNCDIVLASAGASTSKLYAEKIVASGAVLIDNSSAFRMKDNVPLVVAGVNDKDLFNHNGIIANPNCSTSGIVPVLKPLNDKYSISCLIVSTYQAVSGAGIRGINQLNAEILNKQITNPAFAKQIAYNVIPQIDTFLDDGYTREENKVINETKKILHLSPETHISCTAVRVPVLRGHGAALDISFKQKPNIESVYKMFSDSKNIIVMDNPSKNIYPTPLDADNKNPVFVGRIRKNHAFPENGLSMWVVADNLRIGAALNTVRLCELVINNKLYRNR